MRSINPAQTSEANLNIEVDVPYPYDVSFVDCDPSPAVHFQVQEQLARLAHFYSRIIFARVHIRIPHKHSGARLYHVHLQLDVPGRRLVVSREPEVSDKHMDIRPALRDAFHKLTRQLEDFVKSRNEHKGAKAIL